MTASSIARRWIGPLGFLLCVACQGAVPVAVPDPPAWDEILDRAFFEAHLGAGTLESSDEGETRNFVYQYRPTADEPSRILSLVIAVAPAGTFLDEGEYLAARERADADERRRDFPEIGGRAQMLPSFFGPDGASHGVVLTTKDARYDVRIVVSDTGTSSELGAPDPVEVGRDLLRAYRREPGPSEPEREASR